MGYHRAVSIPRLGGRIEAIRVKGAGAGLTAPLRRSWDGLEVLWEH